MQLFTKEALLNILPEDGEVIYFGKAVDPSRADHYFKELLQTSEWKNDESVIFGRHIITKRKVAWYGDNDYSYTYSNITKQALPWTPVLLELKKLTEDLSGEAFNSCLLNLYHNGDEGMAWHSDDEKMLSENASIASFSFGAERRFAFRHKRSKQTISLMLEHGSLLLMKGATQKNWLHSLPKSKKVTAPRINLTFRTMA